MKLYGIVLQAAAPSSVHVLWARPVEGGITFYLFNNGRWQPVKIMNDMGTPSISDDTVSDISNIGEVVEKEVIKQMGEHDEDVNDTHNTPSADTNEYPEIIDMF